MAKVLPVFQKNITQNNTFQNEKWGAYPFQKSIFQGINKNQKLFQTNVFQANSFNGATYEIAAVFDVIPTILKFINESVSVNEAVNRLGELFKTINETAHTHANT